MTGPVLPQDVRSWPTDPYALLSVQPGVALGDLRRVYAQFIRHFKPEYFPEQFRRIREAYDTIVCEVEAAITTARVLANGNVLSPVASAAPLDTELKGTWERAIAGDGPIAYARLAELNAQHPGRSDIYLRLYWLSTLQPNLDGQGAPFEWLLRGARVAGSTPPVGEMIRRELRADPSRALGEGYLQLMSGAPSPEVRQNLADWRWHAAARLRRWDLIGSDLAIVRDGARADGDDVWGRLLFVALNHLAWSEDDSLPDAMEPWRGELSGMSQVHSRLAKELDLLEFLGQVCASWQALRREKAKPANVLELVPICWLSQPAEFRPPLLRFLQPIAQDSANWMSIFDAFLPTGGPVLGYLGALMQRLERDRGDFLSNAFHPISRAFLGGLRPQKYSLLRLVLRPFCLLEAIPPEVVAQVMDTAPPAHWWHRDQVPAQIMADWPLRLVCGAHRTFWS